MIQFSFVNHQNMSKTIFNIHKPEMLQDKVFITHPKPKLISGKYRKFCRNNLFIHRKYDIPINNYLGKFYCISYYLKSRKGVVTQNFTREKNNISSILFYYYNLFLHKRKTACIHEIWAPDIQHCPDLQNRNRK